MTIQLAVCKVEDTPMQADAAVAINWSWLSSVKTDQSLWSSLAPSEYCPEIVIVSDRAFKGMDLGVYDTADFEQQIGRAASQMAAYGGWLSTLSPGFRIEPMSDGRYE